MASPAADRWPAAMALSVAAEYCGISPTQFKTTVANEVPSFQYTERGDRYWARHDLDGYIEDRKKLPVRSRKA